MKNYFNISIFLILVLGISFSSCVDDKVIATSPSDFVVNVVDPKSIPGDTIIVNANQTIFFQFSNGCPDQIMFYTGEVGKEYRFAKRSFYSLSDNTVFESRLTLSTGFVISKTAKTTGTVTTTSNFDSSIAVEDSVFAISGLGNSTVAEFIKATKLGFKQLRSGSSSAATVKDQYLFTATSTPLNLFTGDISFAIRAKSADAIKNMLSLVASTDSLLKNTEVRDYGYSRSGVTVVNKKSIIYPLITDYSTAAWAQYTPDSTVAPGTSMKVANAFGYTWNIGEIGVSYAPAITGGAISLNSHGVKLSTGYPLSIAPPEETKLDQISTGGIPSEAWLVSRVVNPCAVIPDAAIIVKKVDQSSMLYYQYIYKERGIYKASFAGLNVGTNGTAKVAREFVILVQ